MKGNPWLWVAVILLTAGLAAARARGRIGGRKKALSPAQVKAASTLMKGNEMSIKEIRRLMRKNMIALYSGGYEIVGPFYVVKRKDDKLTDMYF